MLRYVLAGDWPNTREIRTAGAQQNQEKMTQSASLGFSAPPPCPDITRLSLMMALVCGAIDWSNESVWLLERSASNYALHPPRCVAHRATEGRQWKQRTEMVTGTPPVEGIQHSESPYSSIVMARSLVAPFAGQWAGTRQESSLMMTCHMAFGEYSARKDNRQTVRSEGKREMRGDHFLIAKHV